jgi:hypothetical protein
LLRILDFSRLWVNIGFADSNQLPMKTHNCKCGGCESAESESSFKINGENLLKKIKELIREGNVRKIVIKDEKGKFTYLEIPVTIGVIGTVLLPILAAVGALAAMVGWVTVEVVKTGQAGGGEDEVSPNKKKK